MASVRLTETLKDEIMAGVVRDFNELIKEAHKQQGNYVEKITEALRAEFTKANEEAVSVVSRLIRSAHSLTDNVDLKALTNSVCNVVDHYDTFHVHADTNDPDVRAKAVALGVTLPVNVLSVHGVFKDRNRNDGEYYSNNALYLKSNKRWNCGWTNTDIAAYKCLEDTEANNALLELALKKAELEASRSRASDYARDHLEHANTLAQLFKRWPEARHYTPSAYIDKMEDKTPAEKKVRVEEPELNRDDLDMNKALAAIRMHGEIRRQLK
jgi:hypothetical protein